MRHKVRGRKLGRNASHRKAMFRNMAASFIKTVAADEDDPQRPAVPGRIVTTISKAKELRPFVEKLVTLARHAAVHEAAAAEFATDAEKGTDAWREWRTSDQWQKWSAAVAPAVAMRRRAFSVLRDNDAVSILFSELAERFEDRQGGYTRIVRLPNVRLGDAGVQALIEFVGERDRVKSKKRVAPVVEDEPADQQPAADVANEESAQESAEDAAGASAEAAEGAADTESAEDKSAE